MHHPITTVSNTRRRPVAVAHGRGRHLPKPDALGCERGRLRSVPDDGPVVGTATRGPVPSEPQRTSTIGAHTGHPARGRHEFEVEVDHLLAESTRIHHGQPLAGGRSPTRRHRCPRRSGTARRRNTSARSRPPPSRHAPRELALPPEPCRGSPVLGGGLGRVQPIAHDRGITCCQSLPPPGGRTTRCSPPCSLCAVCPSSCSGHDRTRSNAASDRRVIHVVS
jgi:hypothetical protein